MMISLFQSMIDTELYSMFITLGPIVSAKIMRDKNSGYSFGYGFVQYENPADAAKAIQQLNGLQVANNKRIKVRWDLNRKREGTSLQRCHCRYLTVVPTRRTSRTPTFMLEMFPRAFRRQILTTCSEPTGTFSLRSCWKTSRGRIKGEQRSPDCCQFSS